MSILNLSESQLIKIAKKAGLSVAELKSASTSLINVARSNDSAVVNVSKMQNASDFYAIRVRSRQTQMQLNRHLMK